MPKLNPGGEDPSKFCPELVREVMWLVTKKGRKLAVHVDQLKPYTTLGEVEELNGLPLGELTVKKVKSHRTTLSC